MIVGKSPLEGGVLQEIAFPGITPLGFLLWKSIWLRGTRHDAAVRGQSDSTFAMSQAS